MSCVENRGLSIYSKRTDGSAILPLHSKNLIKEIFTYYSNRGQELAKNKDILDALK